MIFFNLESLSQVPIRPESLPAAVRDEVNEFAFLQKIHIIRCVVRILDLKESDFNDTLLERIPLEYIGLIFMPPPREGEGRDEWTLVSLGVRGHDGRGCEEEEGFDHGEDDGVGDGYQSEVEELGVRDGNDYSSKEDLGNHKTRSILHTQNRVATKEKRDTTTSLDRSAESSEEDAGGLASDALLSLSFFLYQRAVSLANRRRSKQGITDKEDERAKKEEIKALLEGQQAALVRRLRGRLGTEDDVRNLNSDSKPIKRN